MAFVPVLKSLVLLQLSLLLLNCFTSTTVAGDEVDFLSPDHHDGNFFHPPAESPNYHHDGHFFHPPAESPNYHHDHNHHHDGHFFHPPAESPNYHHDHNHHHPPAGQPSSHAPSYPHHHRWIRSQVAIQGFVFCKSCKYFGFDPRRGAKPLPGAIVKLECHNTKYPIVLEATTDEHGHFSIKAPKKVSTFGAHKCKVSLVSSPWPKCNKPTNLNHGKEGAHLFLPKRHPLPHGHKPPFELFDVGPFAFEPFSKCPHN